MVSRLTFSIQMSSSASQQENHFADPGDNFPRSSQSSAAASTTPFLITTASAPRRARSRAVNSGDFFLAQQLRSPGVHPSPADRYCCPQTYLDLVRSWRCPPFRAPISQLGRFYQELPLLHSSSSSHHGSISTSTGPREAEAVRRTR